MTHHLSLCLHATITPTLVTAQGNLIGMKYFPYNDTAHMTNTTNVDFFDSSLAEEAQY